MLNYNKFFRGSLKKKYIYNNYNNTYPKHLVSFKKAFLTGTDVWFIQEQFL